HEGAGEARGSPRARLPASGRFPRAVPLRAPEGIRDEEFSRLFARGAGLKRLSPGLKRSESPVSARKLPAFVTLKPDYATRIRRYLPVFTGLSRLISSATMSLICS